MNNLEFASFGKRFAALLLDIVIIILINYVLSAVLLAPFGGLTGIMGFNDFQFGENIVKGAAVGIGAVMVFFLSILAGFLVAFLYDFILVASPLHATLGKKLLKIEVLKSNGETLSIFSAFLRSLMKFITGFIFFFLWLICLFTNKKQNLHDLIADGPIILKFFLRVKYDFGQGIQMVAYDFSDAVAIPIPRFLHIRQVNRFLLPNHSISRWDC